MAEIKSNNMMEPEQNGSSSVMVDLDTNLSEKSSVLIQPEQSGSSSVRVDLDTNLSETSKNTIQPEHYGSSSSRVDLEKTFSCKRLGSLLQLDPSLARRDAGLDDSHGDAVEVPERASIKKSRSIPDAVMSRYLNKLDSPSTQVFYLFDSLSRMIDRHPQLLMEVSPKCNRTFLHIAVAANSERQVRKLLDTLVAEKESLATSNIKNDHSSKIVQYLSAEEKVCGYTAYQVACVVGNPRIKRMIKHCLEEINKLIGLSDRMECVLEAQDEESEEEELEHQKVTLKRIGRMGKSRGMIWLIGNVLKSHLEPLGFSNAPLSIMPLEDEFRLHASLMVDASGRSIACWMNCAESGKDIAALLRNLVSELAEQSVLPTFLELHDNDGKTILHYMADFHGSRTGSNSSLRSDQMLDLIFTTLRNELIRLAPDRLSLNVAGRTLLLGVVLKSHLEPLGFPETIMDIMSLGDEFRLHNSLIMGYFGKALDCWIKFDNSENNNVAQLLGEIVSELAEKALLATFLGLQDNAGRTILHYLADFHGSRTGDGPKDDMRDIIFTTLMNELISHAPELNINVKDYVGRTPLHLAAAQGFVKRVDFFANKFEEIDLNATYDMRSFGVNRNGNREVIVKNISPLILAVEKNESKVVQNLLNIPRERSLNVTLKIQKEIRQDGHSRRVWWTPLQLAAYKGYTETLEVLLADDRINDSNQNLSSENLTKLSTIPVLHLAVLGCHPHAVKTLLKCSKIDPFASDSKGSTALHYAFQFNKYEDVSGPWNKVSVSMCLGYTSPEARTKFHSNIGAIIGCIDLLLQAGLDLDHRNMQGQTPHIRPQTPDDVQRWWYYRVATELQETKNNISAATNAISVTAALVAATSFVGPLQPPLGLSNNSDDENRWLLGYSQVNHVAVDIFLFFDSLSFYFAIASIMLALIPSLPVQHETLFTGVKSAQGYLQGAVVLLFASIAFLICTFSAASIVIIPKDRWKYRAITVSTILFGGFICFVALVLFLNRLWRLIKPRSQRRQQRSTSHRNFGTQFS